MRHAGLCSPPSLRENDLEMERLVIFINRHDFDRTVHIEHIFIEQVFIFVLVLF